MDLLLNDKSIKQHSAVRRLRYGHIRIYDRKRSDISCQRFSLKKNPKFHKLKEELRTSEEKIPEEKMVKVSVKK